MPALSACIIARNEAHRLPGLLSSLESTCDEVVVVDTGSEDGTDRVAANLGARVVLFPWTGSFSEARNVSLENASGPWLLCLDADDECPPETLSGIKDLKAGPPERALGFRIMSTQDGVTGVVSSQIRMFPKAAGVRFRYRVHEQIRPSLVAAKIPIRFTDLAILHRGYTDGNIVREKQLRNLALLREDLRDDPKDAYLHYMAAMAFSDLGMPDEALLELEEAANGASKSRDLGHIALGASLRMAEMFMERGDPFPGDADHWLSRAGGLAPDHPEYLYLKGKRLLETGDAEGGVKHLRKLMQCRPPDFSLPVDPVMLRAQGAALLAQILMGQGKSREAVSVIEEAQGLLKGRKRAW